MRKSKALLAVLALALTASTSACSKTKEVEVNSGDPTPVAPLLTLAEAASSGLAYAPKTVSDRYFLTGLIIDDATKPDQALAVEDYHLGKRARGSMGISTKLTPNPNERGDLQWCVAAVKDFDKQCNLSGEESFKERYGDSHWTSTDGKVRILVFSKDYPNPPKDLKDFTREFESLPWVTESPYNGGDATTAKG